MVFPGRKDIVSDFAISNLPTISVAAASVQQEQTEIAPEAGEVTVDLRQALSFVIDEESSSAEVSADELAALEQRRLDLIMWLLNLEVRLSPYCADFA